MQLTSLPRVKAYAAITNADSDTTLTDLITAVSQRIETRLNRVLAETDVTAEKHDHLGKSDRLTLRGYPILLAKPPTVRIDGTAIPGDFAVESAMNGWLVYEPGGDVADWPAGRRHIEVDYSYGYAPSDLPGDLIEAATTQVIWQFNRTGHRGSRLGSRNTVSAEGATATWMVDPWAPEVLDQLTPYKRRRV